MLELTSRVAALDSASGESIKTVTADIQQLARWGIWLGVFVFFSFFFFFFSLV